MKKYVAAGVFALALFCTPIPSRAAELTPLQIQAILSILASFGVDQKVVDTVRTVLTGVAPAFPSGGSAITDQSITILSPLSGVSVTAGVPVTLTWQAVNANSVYIFTLQPLGNTQKTLYSESLTGGQAGCSASLTCSYSFTPPYGATSTVFTIRDRATNKVGTIQPFIITP